jgi:hypothetical protein
MHRPTERNARFWVYYNDGYCKLTLRPGQEVTLGRRSADEEGYSFHVATWTHEGDHVHLGFAHGGRDCDGPISHGGELTCPLDRLAADLDEEMGIYRPDWQREAAWQRDEYAESAGY